MKLFALTSVLAATVASVVGQTVGLGSPTNGQVLLPGTNFTAQVIAYASPTFRVEVGIALTLAGCNGEVCPTPEQGLGSVLYAGSFTPTLHSDGFYQNFTLQVPEYIPTGCAIFTLTHLCLIGAGPYPLLEYRNASVTIGGV